MPKATFNNLSEDKKMRIIRSVVKVFNDKGYDRVTVADIIKEAGIPRGSFYQYFKDKFDCFNVSLEIVQVKKLEYMKDLLERVGKEPFFDLYLKMYEAGILFGEAEPEFFKLGLQLYTSHEKDMVAAVKILETKGLAMMTDLLKKDQEAGFMREDIDVEVLAKVLYMFNAREVIYEVSKGTSLNELLKSGEAFIHLIKYGVMKDGVYE